MSDFMADFEKHHKSLRRVTGALAVVGVLVWLAMAAGMITALWLGVRWLWMHT